MMNSFGRILRLAIFGESHGLYVGGILDGCPAGLFLSDDDFTYDLRRRQGVDISIGTTKRIECDERFIKSGIYNRYTTGAPIMLLFENKQANSADYDNLRYIPRPGHADWVAGYKFGGFADLRGGGHFSGRLTTTLVAAGVIAKKLLGSISIIANIIEVGGCSDIKKAVYSAVINGDSVGGLIECKVNNLPAGLGEPFFDSLESVISHAIFAIPSVKGIEFGSGFKLCSMLGSIANDTIQSITGKTHTNHCGGINGGISNNNELVFRIAIKPTPSISKPQVTLNINTNTMDCISINGRHDACIALRVPVVVEAVTALVIADFMLLEGLLPKVLYSNV